MNLCGRGYGDGRKFFGDYSARILFAVFADYREDMVIIWRDPSLEGLFSSEFWGHRVPAEVSDGEDRKGVRKKPKKEIRPVPSASSR
jgi:hypothetical protein